MEIPAETNAAAKTEKRHFFISHSSSSWRPLSAFRGSGAVGAGGTAGQDAPHTDGARTGLLDRYFSNSETQRARECNYFGAPPNITYVFAAEGRCLAASCLHHRRGNDFSYVMARLGPETGNSAARDMARNVNIRSVRRGA
jgi:hypothetical protein